MGLNCSFLSNQDKWIYTLNNIKKYIIDYKKWPSSINENNEIKYYGTWLKTQQINYSKHNQIMKIEKIRNLWELFINNPIYFI